MLLWSSCIHIGTYYIIIMYAMSHQVMYSIYSHIQSADIAAEVYIVSATDEDIGLNGDILFSLDDPTMPFTISPTTGVITVSRSLDYEIQREYSVSLINCCVITLDYYIWFTNKYDYEKCAEHCS